MAGAGAPKEKRVGRYEVGGTIGHGTFAKVKLAVDSRTGDTVAMKVLDKDTIVRHGMLNQVRAPAHLMHASRLASST
jgi:serine/threonine protein kinase